MPWREQITFDEMMVRSDLFSTKTLSWICILLAHWNNSPRTCRSTRTHYHDSKPTNLCSFLLTPCAERRTNKYQFHSLWFDSIEARTYVLPHLRRAPSPLHNRCDSYKDDPKDKVIYLDDKVFTLMQYGYSLNEIL
jgi:hypothetical protein